MTEEQAIKYAYDAGGIPENVAKKMYAWAKQWYPHQYKIAFNAQVQGYQTCQEDIVPSLTRVHARLLEMENRSKATLTRMRKP